MVRSCYRWRKGVACGEGAYYEGEGNTRGNILSCRVLRKKHENKVVRNERGKAERESASFLGTGGRETCEAEIIKSEMHGYIYEGKVYGRGLK